MVRFTKAVSQNALNLKRPLLPIERELMQTCLQNLRCIKLGIGKWMALLLNGRQMAPSDWSQSIDLWLSIILRPCWSSAWRASVWLTDLLVPQNCDRKVSDKRPGSLGWASQSSGGLPNAVKDFEKQKHCLK